MSGFKEKDYKVFEMFRDQWALVTAGGPEDFNSCTLGWGSLGTIWTRPGGGYIVTVYLHPSRYTTEYLLKNGQFTVSFFPERYRKALTVMGTVSGRDHDKPAEAGLTPKPIGDSVTYREAELTFLCRKIYQHMFSKEDLAPEIQEIYRNNTKTFPPDENGDWQPHWMFIGEILETDDRRRPEEQE